MTARRSESSKVCVTKKSRSSQQPEGAMADRQSLIPRARIDPLDHSQGDGRSLEFVNVREGQVKLDVGRLPGAGTSAAVIEESSTDAEDAVTPPLCRRPTVSTSRR